MTQDRISALFFLAVSIAYGFLASDIRVPAFAAQGVTARTLPYVLAGAGAVIAILMLVLPSKAPEAERQASPFAGWEGMAWGRIALLGIDMTAYGYLLTRLGFILSTSLFLVAGYAILGERRVHILILASVPVVVVFWAILNQFLGIYLGDILGRWGTAFLGVTGGGRG